MREITYRLEQTNDTASIIADIEDRFGRNSINLSRVRGWRREFILKYLRLEPQRWNDNVVKVQVCIEAVKCARDKNEALRYIHTVQRLSKMELHFWTSKFLSNSERARRAWKAMYGGYV